MPRGEIHVELVVDYAEDDKLADVSRLARLLYVDATCFGKRTLNDGVFTRSQLHRLCYPDTTTRAQRQIDELVESGALERREDGRYVMPGFLKRNKSRAQVLELSQARSEAGRRGGSSKREANGKQVASTLLSNREPVASVGLNTETETETETTKPPTPSQARGAKRRTAAPDLFPPTDGMRRFITEHEIPADRATTETQRFLDYHRAKGSLFVDWHAAWRTWMGKVAQDIAPSTRPPERGVHGYELDAGMR